MHKDVINIPFSVFTGHMNFTSGCCDHIRTQILIGVALLCAFKDSSLKLRSVFGICGNLCAIVEKLRRRGRHHCKNRDEINRTEHSMTQTLDKSEMILRTVV